MSGARRSSRGGSKPTAPEPFTPSDCDLRGLPFMPLDVIRIIDSDLFALSTGEEFKAALALWCKAWLQVPAGSLPADERVLAHLAGNRAGWPEVREMALRGWFTCSDGRLYHPVVAEKVNAAWARRGEWRERRAGKSDRQERWRHKLKVLSARLREAGATVPERPKLETLLEMCGRYGVDTNVDVSASTGDGHETRQRLLGQGTADSGQRTIYSVANATDAGAASPERDVAKAADDHLWRAGKEFLISRGKAKTQAGSIIGKWKGKYGTAAVLEAIGVAQREPDLVDPVPFIEKVLQRRSSNDQGAFSIGGVAMNSPC